MTENSLEEKDFTQDGSEVKTRVLRKLWSHLDQNFHKYSEANQIKIMMALCTKDMPQQFEGVSAETKIIIIRDSEKKELDLRPEISHVGREISFNS